MTAAQEQNINIKALAWTIGVHLALLLLFLLWKYTIPTVTPEPEMGMEVNLGTSDNGSGTEQPLSSEDPAADASSVAYKAAAHENNESKDMLQSNEADAPAINAATAKNIDRNNTQLEDKKHRHSNQQELDNNAHRQQRPRYVYTGSTGKGGNGAMQDMTGNNEGNTTGNGDRGVPYGTPGSANYTGSPGNGNGGISHTLTGRMIVAFPPRDASFREEGKVVIRVTVNRDGVVTDKRVLSASSAQLRTIALHKVDKVRFNKSDAAPEEQFGNITFVFKTRS